MFIRSKTVKGKTYYYLVENYRDGKKHRQRVVRYLGRRRPAELGTTNSGTPRNTASNARKTLGTTGGGHITHSTPKKPATCPFRAQCAEIFGLSRPTQCDWERKGNVQQCPQYQEFESHQ